MASQNIHFPYSSNGRTLTSFEWRPIRYRNVISILKNPFYAGVYAYGKSEKRTTIVDGRARKSYGHRKPMGTWEGSPSRIITRATSAGRSTSAIRRCSRATPTAGVAGKRIDEIIAAEMLRAVAPMAIEAAEEAERMLIDEDQDRRRIAELELQQAQYDASLAERRYAACDPDNRLIAAQVEKAWENALQRVERCRERLDRMQMSEAEDVRPDFTGLADDLLAAWKAPRTTMRTRQRLVRALITEIVVNIDEAAGEIVLVIHWKGGQHSELRVRKPRTGEHGCSTPEQALAVIRSMAGRWSDQDIAASLNRMGMPTGQARPGQRTASARCAVYAASTATAPPRRTASG